MLTQEQIAFYGREGYLILEGRIPADQLAACRAEVLRLCEEARGLTTSNERIDLEDSHSPEVPRVRRIKLPHRLSPVFEELMRSEAILEPVRDLIGPDLRLHTSKLNIKAAGFGAAVEWHQDWAFYPHTHDDLLAVGVMLEDVGPDNAPLLVFPGSHRGPVHDHHAAGVFCGAIDLAASDLDPRAAVALTAPAGSISLHHVRLVHGSDVNRSDRPRPLLLYEITAADAYPIQGGMSRLESLEEYDSRLLCGRGTLAPRLKDVPVRLPLPQPPAAGSIYEVQRGREARAFHQVKQAGPS